VLDPWLRVDFDRSLKVRWEGPERKYLTGVVLSIQLFFLLVGKDVVLVKVWMERRRNGMRAPCSSLHLFLQLSANRNLLLPCGWSVAITCKLTSTYRYLVTFTTHIFNDNVNTRLAAH
jgi:hypothetical protein